VTRKGNLMRDYIADMKAAMTEEYHSYLSSGQAERAEYVAVALWETYGVDVDGSRTPPPPAAKRAEPKPDTEPRQKRKYTRKQPLERNDQKAPETLVEVKPEPRAGE
jgi:hypothetical protein